MSNKSLFNLEESYLGENSSINSIVWRLLKFWEAQTKSRSSFLPHKLMNLKWIWKIQFFYLMGKLWNLLVLTLELSR